jgi:hypothetical protein
VSDPGGDHGQDPPAPPDGPSLRRLDPDRAAGVRSPQSGAPHTDTPAPVEDVPAAPAAPRTAPPVIDTRRYRWMIGIIGLVIVLAVSVYQFARHGVGTTGVPAGHELRYFAAPLADTSLNGDANAHPTCSLAHHDPRALNICLMARHGPLVLSFFVTGASQCVRQVSALQTLAGRYPSVQFAAVAVNGSHSATAALIRAHHWTIPVAYDGDGRVGALYGVAACPMVELAARGGVVRDELVGNRWQTASSLAPHVRALAAAGGAVAG